MLQPRLTQRPVSVTSLVLRAPLAIGWYWVGIAACYASRDRLRLPAARLAIRAFRRVLTKAPESPDAWAWIGRAHQRNRDWLEARRSWRSALDLDPAHKRARAGLDGLNIAEARKRLTKGGASEALELLQGIVERDPGNVEAVRLSAWALSLAGHAAAARERLDALIAARADDVDSYVRVGQGLRKDGRPYEAIALFRIALARDPANRRARIFLARTLEKSDPDEAVKLWEGLLADGLVSSEARQVLDRIALARRKQTAKEEERRQQALAKHHLRQANPGEPGRLRPDVEPETPEAASHRQTLAQVRQVARAAPKADPVLRNDPAFKAKLDAIREIEQQGNIGQADQAYIDLWMKYGDSPALLRRYGEYQLRRNNLTGAYELFRRLADDFVNGPFAYRQMARIQVARGRMEQAERLYLDALVEFDDTGLVVDYASFLVDSGRVDEAVESLRRLDWDDRGAVPAYRQLAQHLVQAGHADSALKAFAAGIGRFPQAAALYRDHAKLLNERGKFADAVAVLNRLVAIKPLDAANWSPLVYMIARAERHAEALETLARARAAMGGSLDALCALGRVAERSLMHDSAEALFAEAVQAYPDDPRACAEFGGYFLRQGALRSALRHLSQAVALDPGDAQVQSDLAYVKGALRFLGLESDDGPASGEEVLLPEALFPVVRRLHEAGGRRFDYRPGRAMIVTSSLTAGGAERQAANTVTELVRAHPRVDSVVLGAASLSTRRRRNFYLSRIRHLPIDIVSLEDLAIEDPLGHPDVEPFREILGYFTADIRPDIARWIIVFSAQRPQVVHTWQDYINIAAGVAALLVGVPRLVMGTRNTRPDNKYRRLKRYMHTAYNEMVKLPSVGLINNSIAGARDYEAWLGLREGECGVIWNGLNLSSLTEQAREQSDMRRTLGIPDGVPVMGGVFRMSDEKRPLLWLDTAAIVARAHPDAHFIMCGDGVLYNDVRDYADQLGLSGRVHLPGIVEASDADAGSDRGRMHLPGIVANIGAWYGAMTIFLLASRKEGLPNVLIEAQAFGMPVVSANVGGAAEVIIAGETGWAVDDADAEKLADRVLWCLARPDWMEACKGKAPGFVNATFSLDAMAAKTLTSYQL